MVSLKESAENYEPPQTMNIADLELVPVDCQVEERTFKEGTEDEFKVNVALVNGEAYRVPNSVLDALKTLVKEMPDIKYVRVIKEGSGLNTRYKTVPKSAPVNTGQAQSSAQGPTEVSSQQM